MIDAVLKWLPGFRSGYLGSSKARARASPAGSSSGSTSGSTCRTRRRRFSLAFSNALAVSLFGLVPGNNVGYPAVVLGVIGILFTAAGIRSIHSSPSTLSQRRHQLGLITLLVVIFGAELGCGIVLIIAPGAIVPAQVISNALAASLLTGIGRAWELVGDRRTNITSSIAVLTGTSPARQSRPAARWPKPVAPPKLPEPPK